MSDLRLLPDVQLLVNEVLAAAGCDISPDVPANIAAKLPRLTVYKVGGVASDQALLDKPQLFVIAWANTYAGAANLAETARVLLFNAWRSQFTSTHGNGTIHRVVETSSPSENRGVQPDGVFRFDARYTVQTRP